MGLVPLTYIMCVTQLHSYCIHIFVKRFIFQCCGQVPHKVASLGKRCDWEENLFESI